MTQKLSITNKLFKKVLKNPKNMKRKDGLIKVQKQEEKKKRKQKQFSIFRNLNIEEILDKIHQHDQLCNISKEIKQNRELCSHLVGLRLKTIDEFKTQIKRGFEFGYDFKQNRKNRMQHLRNYNLEQIQNFVKNMILINQIQKKKGDQLKCSFQTQTDLSVFDQKVFLLPEMNSLLGEQYKVQFFYETSSNSNKINLIDNLFEEEIEKEEDKLKFPPFSSQETQSENQFVLTKQTSYWSNQTLIPLQTSSSLESLNLNASVTSGLYHEEKLQFQEFNQISQLFQQDSLKNF